MRIGNSGITPNRDEALPFVTFSATANHISNGDKYGHVVNAFSMGTGPKDLRLNTVTDAQVVYPSVAARGGMLDTLTRIGKCGGTNGKGVCLYGTSGHPIMILRGGRTSIGLSILGKR